jgi:hypothetical protein
MNLVKEFLILSFMGTMFLGTKVNVHLFKINVFEEVLLLKCKFFTKHLESLSSNFLYFNL